MTQLVRYEQARTALALCHSVDEVKDIRDKAEAMAAYARQAKDQDLILWATEIRVRAERKAGELILEKRATGEMVSAGGDRKIKIDQTSLKDYGISGDQGVRWTALASMPSEHFESAVATAKDTAGQVTAAMVLATSKSRPSRKPTKADAERIEKLNQVKGTSMLVGYIRMVLKGLRERDTLSEEERTALGTLKAEIDRAIAH